MSMPAGCAAGIRTQGPHSIGCALRCKVYSGITLRPDLPASRAPRKNKTRRLSRGGFRGRTSEEIRYR